MREKVERHFDKLEESVMSSFLDIVKDTLSEVLQEYPSRDITMSSHDSPQELAESWGNTSPAVTNCDAPTSFKDILPPGEDYSLLSSHSDFHSDSFNSYFSNILEPQETWPFRTENDEGTDYGFNYEIEDLCNLSQIEHGYTENNNSI